VLGREHHLVWIVGARSVVLRYELCTFSPPFFSSFFSSYWLFLSFAAQQNDNRSLTCGGTDTLDIYSVAASTRKTRRGPSMRLDKAGVLNRRSHEIHFSRE
jgi:hypothetical protein